MNPRAAIVLASAIVDEKPVENPFAAPATSPIGVSVLEEEEEPAFYTFGVARVRRVVYFFVIMYAISGALALAAAPVLPALVSGLFLLALQIVFAVIVNRAPRGAMLATAILFWLLLLLTLVTNPLSAFGVGNLLGLALSVYGIREANTLRRR